MKKDTVGKHLFNNTDILAGIYLFKVNNGNIRKMCEICSKLTIKTTEQHQWPVPVVNFEQISQIVLVFPLLNLNKELSQRMSNVYMMTLNRNFPKSYTYNLRVVWVCLLAVWWNAHLYLYKVSKLLHLIKITYTDT